MTKIGAGGVVIKTWSKTKRFQKDYGKLTQEMRDTAAQKLRDLVADPRPPGLRFEKLRAYDKPSIFTIHITGNYKLSMSIVGSHATLRRVGTHNDIDRSP